MAIPSHISSGPWSPSAQASAAAAAENQRDAMELIIAEESAASAKRVLERMAEIEAEANVANCRRGEWAEYTDEQIIAGLIDEALTDCFVWPDADAAWNDARAE